MKKIIVPIDFSDQSKYALDFAVEVAKKGGMEILAINIIEGPHAHTFNTMADGMANVTEDEFFLKQLYDKTEENLAELIAQEKYSGVVISKKVEIGNPYKSISHAIADQSADLVVMGTKGISGLDEVLIGSNTEKVVRYSHCPVITVKSPVNLNEFKNIVFATNLQEDQTDVINELKKLQLLTGAQLHLVKVNTPNNFITQRKIESDFADYIAKHGLTNVDKAIYSDNTEEDGILSYAEDIEADLIALATHGRTGLLHLLSGSIAEDLVNHSQIPVWTYSMKKKK